MICIEKLSDNGWNEWEILQLTFLKAHMDKMWHEDSRYPSFDILEEMFRNAKLNECVIEQIIKCIVHRLPYKLFLNSTIKKDEANEIRRFMEDSGCKIDNSNVFEEIAFMLVSLEFPADVIYQFRRFWKTPQPLTFSQSKRLIEWINTYTRDWMVVAALFDVYSRYGFSAMMSFADDMIEKYHIGSHFRSCLHADIKTVVSIYEDAQKCKYEK